MSGPVNNIINAFYTFFQNFFGFFTGRKNKLRVEYRNPKSKPISKSQSSSGGFSRRRGNAKSDNNILHQERVDAILEKIKKSSYESLTEEEKEFLFNASKK